MNNKQSSRIIILSVILLMVIGMMSSFAQSLSQKEEEKVLNIYNWSDYIDEETIPAFEKETGIKVNYDVFDSNEVLEAKLLAGSTGYDLVVPSGTFLERQIKAGIFMKLDKSKLSNFKNVDKEIETLVSKYDADNEYGVVYMWGTTGIGYNVDKVKSILGSKPLSWSVILDPATLAKFKSCGVAVLDAPTEMVAIVLNYLGIDPDSKKYSDLEKAKEHLKKLRPYVRYFHSSQYINDLANGDICLAIGWSGDVLQARDRAAEADQGINVDYLIPSEGAQMWFDLLAIPTDAKHPKNAHRFINFVMQAQIAANISNYVYYANGNAASTSLIDKEVTEDPAIYPPESVKKKLYVASANNAKYDRVLNRAWTSVKTGK